MIVFLHDVFPLAVYQAGLFHQECVRTAVDILAAGGGESDGVEMDELQVGEVGAGLQGEGVSVPQDAFRGGGILIYSRCPPSSQDGGSGRQGQPAAVI